MELGLLLHFCELEAETHQLPYTVYDHRNKMYCSSPDLNSIDLLTPTLSMFENSVSNVNYFIADNFLIFGYVKSTSDEKLLFIGPSAIGMFSEKEIEKNINRIESKIDAEEKKYYGII